MQKIEEVPDHEKSGCLKWSCLGCLGVIILTAGGSVLLWYYVSHWKAGESAWEHLPPSVSFAVEVHDLDGLLQTGLNDPGMQYLLTRKSDDLQRFLAEISEENPAVFSQWAGDLAEAYESFRFLMPAVVPNTVLIGISESWDPEGEYDEDDDGDSSEFFFIFRPPAWMRWLLTLPSRGRVGTLSDDSGATLCTLYQDGWLVLASSDELAEEIRDNWNARALPLGPASLPSGPRILIALTAEEERDSELEVSAPGDSPPLMLTNPFLPPEDSPAEEQDENFAGGAGRYVRMTVIPSRGEWEISLEAIEDDSPFIGTLEEKTAEVFSAPGSRPHLPAGAELALTATLDPEFLAQLRENDAEAAAPADSEARPAWMAAAVRLLDGARLSSQAQTFALLAAPPEAGEVQGVPPLPVLSLGWLLGPETDSEAAAEDFSAAVSEFLEAVSAPGGTPLVQALRGSVKSEVFADVSASGGTVRLPPVLANSAAPSWRFPFGGVPGQGWISTDPSGLPELGFTEEQWGLTSLPGGVSAGLGAAWVFTSAFLDPLEAVLAERPAWLLEEEDREEFEEYFAAARMFLTAFPYGRAEALIQEDPVRLVLRVSIAAAENAGQPARD